MRTILIVDDEPFIVNGLVGLIKEADFPGLEVFKANSAQEAIQWFERAAMDIVLTDISMPGMDGLELQKRITQQWPRCKVIFLTGYNDFSYIKEAIHYRAVDYILKTEGDQAILLAVQKALDELDSEIEKGEQLEKAQLLLQAAMPMLRDELLSDVLHGTLHPSVNLEQQLIDLQLPLLPDEPVMLVLCRLDDGNNLSPADTRLLLYAVQNIAEEYLSASARLQSIIHAKSQVIWFVQPLTRDVHEDYRDSVTLIRLVHSMVERIQQTCKELLRLKLSFAVAKQFIAWTALPGQFDSLRRTLRRSLGMGHELLLIDEAADPVSSAQSPDAYMRRIQKEMVQLEICLESGNASEFNRTLGELLHDISPPNPGLQLAASFQLMAMILSYTASDGLMQSLTESIDLNQLQQIDAQDRWEDTLLQIAQISEAIFRLKAGMVNQHERSLVHQIRQYIAAHLDGDLSLTRIGEVVCLNPFYLSRLYKQLTGESLTDTIMSARLSEAKQLLKNSNEKVQHIATQVGFESAAYFTRFFKKATGHAPQEYRELSRS